MPDRALTVLVIEDEAVLRAITQRMLELAGHRAILCTTAGEALAVIDEDPVPFDVLVTDIMLDGYAGLGGLDGLAIAAAVCRRRPGLPLVIMSGQHPGEVTGRLPEGCPTRFVAKPWTRESLVAAIEGTYEDAHDRGGGRPPV